MSWRYEKARELIKKHGRRTDWLANQLGIEVRSLRNMLRGTSKPSLPVIKLMAAALDCSETDLQIEDGSDRKKA